MELVRTGNIFQGPFRRKALIQEVLHVKDVFQLVDVWNWLFESHLNRAGQLFNRQDIMPVQVPRHAAEKLVNAFMRVPADNKIGKSIGRVK